MTSVEFEFWQKAYLAAITGAAVDKMTGVATVDNYARLHAQFAVKSYRETRKEMK